MNRQIGGVGWPTVALCAVLTTMQLATIVLAVRGAIPNLGRWLSR